jgi:hypothetical protein
VAIVVHRDRWIVLGISGTPRTTLLRVGGILDRSRRPEDPGMLTLVSNGTCPVLAHLFTAPLVDSH